METNGTIHRRWLDADVRFNVSPKLAHAGMDEHVRLTKALADYTDDRCTWKFVVNSPADVFAIERLREEHKMRSERIYLMPEARTVAELDERLPMVSEAAIRHGYNVSDRLHLRLWGGKRGH